MSENPTSADNQQERLIQIGWIAGFVDGEGCFSISFIKQPSRANRRGYKTGYQVSHEFVVTQGSKSIDCLHQLQKFFGVGQVIVNKRYDNHKEHLYRYAVRKRQDLLQIIIPFFQTHSLHSSKRHDFEKFVRCLEIVESRKHLTHSGLTAIACIVETMNRCKPKNDLVRILRDYTSDTVSLG